MNILSDLVSMISADGVTGALSAIVAVAVFQSFASLRERRHRQWALEDRAHKEAVALERAKEKEAERERTAREAKPRALRAALETAIAAERSWVEPPGYFPQAMCHEHEEDMINDWQRYDRDFLEPLYGIVRNLRKHGFTPSMGARRRWTREQLAQLVSELEKVAPAPEPVE